MKLATYEKKLSTLQLSLEILGEWCSSLDAEGLGASTGAASGEEEGWGGISALDEEGDVEMGGEAMEDDDEMSGDAEEDDEDDDDEAEMAVELSGTALTLIEELPKLLLALALPTPLSFLPPPTTDATPASAVPNLIPTSTAGSTNSPHELPLPLVGLAEILTTVHVRALECLNNLYITLARSISTPSGTAFLQNTKNVAELQTIWEEVLGLVLQNSTASPSTVGVAGVVAGKGKAANANANANANGEEDLVAERRMEMVMAGAGAAWGMARIGLSPAGRLVRISSDCLFTMLTPRE